MTRKIFCALIIISIVISLISCSCDDANRENQDNQNPSEKTTTYETVELTVDNYFLYLDIDNESRYVGRVKFEWTYFYKYSYNVTVTPTVWYEDMSFENVNITYDLGTDDLDIIIIDTYGRGVLNTEHFHVLDFPSLGSVKSITGKVTYRVDENDS